MPHYSGCNYFEGAGECNCDELSSKCKFCGLIKAVINKGVTRCITSPNGQHVFTLPNRQQSVLQDWVMRLPLREQGTLLTAVRGCDDEPKTWTARGVAESTGRRITAFIRWCFMNPADPREVDVPGAFFQSTPPVPFKPSGFGHLPQHWYAHVMHALEVCAYRHPDEYTARLCLSLYAAMVHNMHLNIETQEQFEARLSEDRIASGEVVS